MNREDITRMAREAGMEIFKNGHRYMDEFDIYKFAALVASAEREACAKLADEIAANYNNPTASECAAAIRSRN